MELKDQQQKVLDCLEAVTGRTLNDPEGDFFGSGSLSLGRAGRFMTELSNAFKVPVSIREIRKYHTAGTLAQYLSKKEQPGENEGLSDYPLTQTQSGILAECLTHPDSVIYNFCSLFRLSDEVDINKLRDSVEKAINAHPYLSATLFADESGNYRLKRNDTASAAVEIIKTGKMPEDPVKPFELLNSRLYRAQIFETDEGNYLFIDLHHMLADGTGLSVLFRDINAAYGGEILRKETYSGFEAALDETELRKSSFYEEDRAYYEDLLKDADKDMVLLGDLKKEEASSDAFTFTSSLLSEDIKTFCRENSFAESAFFNALFGFMIAEYGYRDEALFTTIYTGRNDSRMEDTTAMLVKTLPVLCRFNRDQTVKDLIGSLSGQILESASHDLYSFAEISSEYDINADLMLAYQGRGVYPERIGGKECTKCFLPLIEAQRPLSIDVFTLNERVSYVCEYRSDLYSEDFLKAFLEAMDMAAQGFLTEEYIRDVEIFGKKERELFEKLNDTEFPVELKSANRLFEERVKAHPEKTAVISGDESLTYSELNERANSIANFLRKKGLKTGDIVGMVLERGIDGPVAEMGILKAGGAFLPMLPDYPDDRISYCMKDSGSRFLITSGEFIRERSGLIKEGDFEAVDITKMYEAGKEDSGLSIPADSPAYCIYTSGSTGKPKGVMIEHKNLCNFVNANEKNDESHNFVSYGDVALSIASFSFDFSIMEIHLSLDNGMTLVIARDEEIQNPLLFAKMIERTGVQVICGTPSFLANLLEVPEAFASLKNIGMYDLGAEAFPPSLYGRLKAASPKAVIVNGYGPTETTISCISKVMEGEENITIGKPAANVTAHIMDKRGKLLPAGAKGELVIGGLGVGRGYINLPEKTEEAFISLEGRRAYRSGDLARLSSNGEIEFFGRLDNQVKLHGLRIELDEIENVINTYPSVQRCVVLIYSPEDGDQFLCAWFTAGEEVDVSELKAHAAKHLARYMIPSAFVQIPSIPLTQNGKVDRKALPKPERLKAEEVIPPENETQQKIFDCAAGVIGSREFGINTDLYDAGLTSLGAIRLNVLLSKEFGTAFSIRDLQEDPTVRGLEGFLSSHEKEEAYELRDDYPLSKTQYGILVESLAHPDTVIYNVPLLVKLPEGVELKRFKEAVEAAIKAHPYMNAVIFADEKGDFRAARNDDLPAEVTVEERDSLPEDLLKPFDLAGGRLYRAKIFVTGEGTFFFLECHHIIYDGGSEAVLLDDIREAYEGNRIEKEGYTGFEFALDEEKQRGTERLSKAKDYFTSLISEADHDMLPERDVDSDTEVAGRLVLETSLSSDAVEDFCRRNNVTENAFFNAAFACVLARFAGKEEALYTTVYNGRNDSRLARAVCMLVKTFPVYATTQADRKIGEFVSSMGQQLMDSMSNDIYSFAEMAEDLEATADIMFVYQGRDEGLSLDGERCENRSLALDTAKAPIHIDVFEEGSKVILDSEYRSDLYSEAMIKSLVSCLEQVLKEFLIKQVLGEVEFLSSEALKTLDSFNETEVSYDKSQTLVSIYRASAASHAQNIAVICGDKKLTYAEEDELSEKIAAFVSGRGLKKGDVVSVLIPRTEYMPVASLGALKAGCAYQPLDTTYPPERLNFMVKDASARLVITTRELRPVLNEYEGEVLYLEDIPSLPAPSKPLDIKPDPEDTFILLYTSGSTGVPKGVRLTHRNIVCFVEWQKRYYGLTEKDRVGAYASYGFDAHMIDTYPTLAAGAAEVIVPEDIRLDLIAMNEYLEKNGVTHIFMTTQVGRQFALSGENRSLKSLSVGGEKLVTLDPPSYRLVNIYGPTETMICITAYEVEKREGNIPIGKPLDNVKLYVVGSDKKRVPVGALGELWAAGPHVGNGYLNRPEKTAEVFIENPFVSKDSEYSPCYRTGDIVRYLPDGNIQYIGRRDGQVKVRGFRIEMSEVEAVLREYPGIKDATVAAFDHPAGGRFIAAYVVSDEEVDPQAVGDFIRERKPPYMVPETFTRLDKIPLNQNGKVNKRVLPKPEIGAAKKEKGSGVEAPLNVLEKEIRNVVSEIIGSDEFGITDNFRDLGLTSISGIRLAMQLFRKFDVQINAKELAAGGTIQSVENVILEKLLKGESSGGRSEKEEEKTQRKEEKNRSCRLTFSQQGVYAECQANPDNTIYNIPFALKFPSGVDADTLSEALKKVVEAHSYILCRFTQDKDNEVIQEPVPDYKLTIPVKEMTASEFENYKKDFVRPFDLKEGPCARFEIIKADRTILLADMHHLVSDGASMDIFFEELCRAVDGVSPEKEDYTYYDYAADEKLEDGVEEFFEKQMGGVEEATRLIPDVFEEGLPHTEKGASVSTDHGAVKKFAIKEGVTPAGVYLAAVYIACQRFVCEDTVSIATIANGRSNLKIANTMGMFVNTLPLVSTPDNSEDTKTFVKRVSENFRDTIDHEHYPFARIGAKYDFHPQVSYSYQIGILTEYKTKAGEVLTEEMETDAAKLPVSVQINGTEEDARVTVLYDSSMYTEDMMKGFAKAIDNAVCGLIERDRLSDISITDESQWKVLDSFNKDWDLDFDKEDTAVTLFRKNAKTLPDKTAAVFKDKSYTYKELDELTDILASKIYKKVCTVTGKTDLAEEVVSLLLHRNENVFILPLAVLKAGLAYEPLDPAYPKERLNFMVRDAKACLLIADDDLKDLVDEYEGEKVTVSDLNELPASDRLPEGSSPSDMFIMLYTSGSTGTPKGCQLEHRNLVSYAHGVRNDFYTREDNIAAYASFGFDVNMSDIFCTLLNGGTVYLIPEEIRMQLNDLAAYFNEVKITALLLTTQVGVQFLQNYPDMKYLRMLVMGGEKLPSVDPSKISYTIVNGYGPTENCCGVSLFPIKEWEPNIPIGKPMATIHGYVLDKTGHRLPAGAAGEYCLSGPQVSRGYLNRPDKTAEAYEACPFNEFRMYHTGDIVRYRKNGDVEFVGRKDGQVKIRGFRIETKEVEAVIRGFEGIKDVTVQAYDYESGGKYLAAFVVSPNKVDITKLTEYIKSQKPAYMVPAVTMQIDEIPLTVNQKVDKKALPKPRLQKAAYVAPRGKTEEDFCLIFGNILGIEKVSAEDDFFEIGGSSILAMKVVIAAGQKGYGIVYNDVFKYTTPRAMAEFLGAGSEEKSEETVEAALTGEVPVKDREGYDYTAIHDLLSRNTEEAFKKGVKNELKDVLLFGGTGYLGSHVLKELIENHSGRICCFVRAGKDETGEERLKKTLKFYFGDDHADLFGSRITVIEGDATDPASLEGFKAFSDDFTAINCAASVKHFAKGDEINRVNVESVKNICRWCENNKARLVHISTGSVFGSRQNNIPPVGLKVDEHMLYVGQVIDNNQYVHSKFMAERHIYEEILKNSLKAKVLRVGNLSPRAEDGRFQANYRTNSFMNSIKAHKVLKMAAIDMLDAQVEFSPIDCVSKAVVTLSQAPDECVCFMPLNPHRAIFEDIIEGLDKEGFKIRIVESEEFAAGLEAALSDDSLRDEVSSLIAYQNKDTGISEIGPDEADMSLTVHALKRLGFSWPETGEKYIRSFIGQLKKIGFFGGDEK